MPEPSGAAGQLERILYILPRAAREGGASLMELSESLGVDIPVVLRDLTQVSARAFYHPAGGEELLLEIEGGRVNLFTPGAFRRPVRLSMPEAVCLGLALRGRLAGRWGKITGTERPPGTLHLLRALETTLSTVPTEDFLARIEAADLRPDPAGLREILSRAMGERKACRIQYLKPGDEGPEIRTVWPYAMVHGEGHWYLLGHCTRSNDVRRFRLDRVLHVETTGEGFPAPEDFDPGAHIHGGRVFRGDETLEVRVRYSSAVARWVGEQEAVEPAPDGSLTLTHPVADPHWIVRHVLQYGPEAEVLDPAEARGWVRDAVECWSGTP